MWVLAALTLGAHRGASGAEIALVASYALVGLAVGVAAGALLEWVLTRGGRTAGRLLQSVTRSVGGATAGATLAMLLQLSGQSSRLPAVMLVIVPAIAAPWLLDVMEQVSRARADILEQRARLVREAAELLATSTAQESVVAEIRATITHAVDSELAPARAGVARQLAALEGSASNVATVSGRTTHLRDVTQDSLRPLISTLNAADAVQAEPLGLGGAMRAIIATQPFHPTPLAVVYVLTTLPAFWLPQGPALATLNVAIGVAAIYAILGAGNAVMRSGRVRHGIAFIATFIVLQAPSVAYAFVTIGGPEAAVASIASVLVSGTLVLLTSSLGSWRDRQEAAQQTFRDLLNTERIETLAHARVAADVARQAAHALHGPVQARLAACAVALDEAARSGDSDGQIAALHSAQEALRFQLFDNPQTPVRDLPTVLAAAVAPWAGLVEIGLEITPGMPSPTAIHAIEQVVEEAITNAVRHGGARLVLVRVEHAPGRHHITVDDDGCGVHEALPGVGLSLYERVTGGRWSLSASGLLAGARLTAVVPD